MTVLFVWFSVWQEFLLLCFLCALLFLCYNIMDRESRSQLHDHSRRTVRRQLLPNQNHSAERTLDLPEIIDDYYLNLLDWSSSNIVAIALGNTVHLWDASNGSAFVLLNKDQENGPITSVSWAPNGQHIAIGMKSAIVEIWDTTVNQKLRTLQGGHRSRVGSLSLNNDILSTGGKDALIINNDVRIRSHIMQTNRGHHEEVCGLKWSGSGRQLVSGGIDNLLHIWDLAIASSNSPTQWIHRFERSRGYREGTSMESISGQSTRFCWW